MSPHPGPSCLPPLSLISHLSSKRSLSSPPSSLPALVFNSRSEFHIHLRRAQCRVTLPRLHFMFQCLERSGWRKTRSACPHTCVSVCAPGAGTDRWTDGQVSRGDRRVRMIDCMGLEGQALRAFSHDFTPSPERL